MLAVRQQRHWPLNTLLAAQPPSSATDFRVAELLMPAEEFIRHDDCGAPTYLMQRANGVFCMLN